MAYRTLRTGKMRKQGNLVFAKVFYKIATSKLYIEALEIIWL